MLLKNKKVVITGGDGRFANVLKQKKNKFKIKNRNLSSSQIEFSYSSNRRIKKLLKFEFTDLEKGINNSIQNIL